MRTRLQFVIQECWLGQMLLAATERGVCATFLGSQPDELVSQLKKRFPMARRQPSSNSADTIFEQWRLAVSQRIDSGKDELFIPLDLRGTSFQKSVWLALQKIPYGQTTDYTQIAQRIGKPKSVRAVAAACGANPVSVLIPCHRVLRKDGSLSGYRWGVERKQKLLERESRP